MTDRTPSPDAAVLDELIGYATSHAALKAGRGNVDDVIGFVDWYRRSRLAIEAEARRAQYVTLRDAISAHIERAARETGTYHGDPTGTPGGTGYCLPAAVATQIVDKYLLEARPTPSPDAHEHVWKREYAPGYRQASEADDWREECECGAFRTGTDAAPDGHIVGDRFVSDESFDAAIAAPLVGIIEARRAPALPVCSACNGSGSVDTRNGPDCCSSCAGSGRAPALPVEALAEFFHQEYWSESHWQHVPESEAESTDCSVCWSSAHRLYARLGSESSDGYWHCPVCHDRIAKDMDGPIDQHLRVQHGLARLGSERTEA